MPMAIAARTSDGVAESTCHPPAGQDPADTAPRGLAGLAQALVAAYVRLNSLTPPGEPQVIVPIEPPFIPPGLHFSLGSDYDVEAHEVDLLVGVDRAHWGN